MRVGHTEGGRHGERTIYFNAVYKTNVMGLLLTADIYKLLLTFVKVNEQ